MNIEKYKEPIQLSIHFGEASQYDRKALKGYICENELKKAIKGWENVIRYHLKDKFGIKPYIEIKTSDVGDPNPTTEGFSIIELINNKLTSANSQVCISTYEIFKERGIVEAISALHKLSPLTVI